MQDPFPIIPSCFFPSDGGDDHDDKHHFADDVDPAAIAKPGRSVVASVYRTKIGGRCRPITVTWCRDLLGHGFSVSVGPPDSAAAADSAPIGCKVELRPWQFWRRHGSKRFLAGGTAVEVFWDLRSAKFCGEPEAKSSYYVAVAADGDLALLLGDLRKEAYRKSGRQPAPIEAALVSRKEHIFGRKSAFSTRSKFHEKGRPHEITIECKSGGGGGGGGSSFDSEMAISVDGEEAITVKHLQWKFRGNQSITVSKAKVEVYWDVHDWLFSPGLRHALFVFKPTPMMPCSSTSSSSSAATLSSLLSTSSPSPTEKKKKSSTSTISTSAAAAAAAAAGVEGCSGYCLFLYAWKLD